MTAPTTAGGAVLPKPFGCVTKTANGQQWFYPEGQSPYLDNALECITIYAQAEIDALRAENERLTRERDHALMAASCEATAGDEARDALKAALNPPAHTPPTGVFVQAAQDDQARPIRMERARGDTVAEMRKNLSPELWGHGDAVICWVNEGDYICAAFAATKETP